MSTLALVLAAALSTPVGDVEAVAKSAFELAEAGKVAEARRMLDDAYARDGSPALLYVRGIIEQTAGECERANDFYRRYLATDPADADAKAARDGIEACGGDVVPAAPLEPGASASPGAVPPPTIVDAPPPPAWQRDRLAAGFIGAGVPVTIAGATLLGVGLGLASNANRVDSESEFGTRLDRGRALTIAGGVVLPIGTALIIAGAIRYAKLRRARGSEARTL